MPRLFFTTHILEEVKIRDGSLIQKINKRNQREVISAIETFFNIK